MSRLKQTIGGLALVLGGLLSFNPKANAQEAPEKPVPKKPLVTKVRSLEDVQSGIKNSELRLHDILRANKKSSVEYSVDGKTYVAGFNPKSLIPTMGVHAKDNPFRGYIDEKVDGQLDSTPYGDNDSLKAHLVYEGLLAQAVKATKAQFKDKKESRERVPGINSPQLKRARKQRVKRLSDKEKTIYKLAEGMEKEVCGQVVFKIDYLSSDGKDKYRFNVSIGGYEVASGKPPKHVPKKIDVSSMRYNGPDFGWSHFDGGCDLNGDGELELGNVYMFEKGLDLVIEKYSKTPKAK